MPSDELPTKNIVFSRINVAAHKTLAEQMAEWEKKNTVKVYQIGATAEFQTINAKAENVKKRNKFKDC